MIFDYAIFAYNCVAISAIMFSFKLLKNNISNEFVLSWGSNFIFSRLWNLCSKFQLLLIFRWNISITVKASLPNLGFWWTQIKHIGGSHILSPYISICSSNRYMALHWHFLSKFLILWCFHIEPTSPQQEKIKTEAEILNIGHKTNLL